MAYLLGTEMTDLANLDHSLAGATDLGFDRLITLLGKGLAGVDDGELFVGRTHRQVVEMLSKGRVASPRRQRLSSLEMRCIACLLVPCIYPARPMRATLG